MENKGEVENKDNLENKGEVENKGDVSWPFPWKDPEYDSDEGPNWKYNVDSDGEKYEVYSDGTHEMTNKEWNEYARQVQESDGYDVQAFEDVEAFGIIQPVDVTEDTIPEFERLASLALSEYNNDKGTRLQVKEIKKTMIQVVTGMTFYLTFDVVDLDAQDPAKIQVFQARVLQLFKKGEYEIEQIRPKPTV